MSLKADRARAILGRIGALVVSAAACVALAGPPEDAPASPDAAIEEYLADRSLTDLLGSQLRRRLGESTGTERVSVAERLGRLYVTQLGVNLPPDDRRTIEQLSRDLLRAVPEADSFALRLDLAKASYEKVMLLYPETSWAGQAKERLTAAEGKPQQPAAPAAAQPKK